MRSADGGLGDKRAFLGRGAETKRWGHSVQRPVCTGSHRPPVTRCARCLRYLMLPPLALWRDTHRAQDYYAFPITQAVNCTLTIVNTMEGRKFKLIGLTVEFKINKWRRLLQTISGI